MGTFLDLIRHETQWSWSIIALIVLIVGLIVRHIILRAVLLKIKHLPGDAGKSVQREYAKRSLIGWVLFGLAIVLTTLIGVLPDRLALYLPLMYWYLMVIALFGISLYSHMQAYLDGLIQLVEDKLSSGREA